ncbi:hypothetical protein [Seohaeicola saemankumensis]|uniref:hypothetical protein n=1 Tax=Seohaeicola saemankumensis TaxID=481181 RepID=UPI0036D2D7D7
MTLFINRSDRLDGLGLQVTHLARDKDQFGTAARCGLIHVNSAGLSMCHTEQCKCALTTLRSDRNSMNRIIYIVGLVVIVLFILGFLGLR